MEELFPYKISAIENEQLCRRTSRSEAEEVIWSMGPLKAPGLDGMPCKFYKDYLNIVGEDVYNFVCEFFGSAKFTKAINQSFLVIIPKKSNTRGFDDFRPISLCNVAYKVVSKLLTNRLRSTLRNFISPFHAAFIPRRWIAENPMLAYEIMHAIKKKSGRKCLM